MGNSFFNEYPYTDFHELNLSWVIKELRSFATTLEQFVSINALKYADPIDWDITKQYEKNTIVIDPQSGTAYISVAAVPAGVALTNTDYWTVVFDLEQFVTKAVGNFTSRVEYQTTLTATFATPQGNLVVWGGDLYVALANITPGDQYVPDGNIKRITVEDIIGRLVDLTTTDKTNIVAAINEVVSIITSLDNTIGDLSDLTTTDKTNIVAAINEVLSAVINEITRVDGIIGDLNDLTTTDKTNIVAAINEVVSSIINEASRVDGIIGDLNDLTTTDKTSVVNAINSVVDDIDTLSDELKDGNYVVASSFTGATDTEILQNAVDNADFVILDRDFNITSVNITKPTHLNLGGYKVTSNTNENNTFNVRSSDVTIFNGEIFTTENDVSNARQFGSCVYVNDWVLAPPIAQHINLHDLKLSTNATASVVYYGEMCYSEVYNIEFDGSRAAVIYPEGINFEWTGTRHVITYHPHDIIVRNCYAHDYNSTGGYPFRTSAAFNMIFENLYIYRCRDGISFEPGDYAGEAALSKYQFAVNKNLTARNITMSDVRIGLSVIGVAGYQNGDITCHCSNILFINPRSNSEGIETNNAVNCVFENVKIDGGLYGVLSRGVNETYQNCDISNIGDVGFYMLGSDTKLINNTVKNVNKNGNTGVTGSAIFSSGERAIMNGNKIGGGVSEAMIHSIRLSGNNSIITDNILYSLNVTDVSTGSIKDNNILITP